MRAPKAIVAIGCVAVVFQAGVDACEWDYPIWPKDKRSDTPLFRFVVNGKKGFINAQGKIAIPAQFSTYGNYNEDDFFEGVGGGDGPIDSSGRPISFAPLVAGHFSQGLIPIASSRESNSKLGFADHSGRVIIPPKFDEVKGFTEGLAAVKVDGRWGYIDRAGTIAIQPRYYLAEPFSDGAARVVERAPCNFTGHDPCDGFNPIVLGFSDFRSGVDKRYRACQYSFIDRKGVALFPRTFPDAYDFSEGLAPANDGKLWGIH